MKLVQKDYVKANLEPRKEPFFELKDQRPALVKKKGRREK
jgi:hypothetical protein